MNKELERVRAAIEEAFGGTYGVTYSGATTKYGRMYSAKLHGGSIVQAYVNEKGTIRIYDPSTQRWVNPITSSVGGRAVLLLGAGLLFGFGAVMLYKSLTEEEKPAPPPMRRDDPDQPLVIQTPEIIEV